MTLTIALPCEVEASLASEAARAGLPIDAYVLQVLRDHTAPQATVSQTYWQKREAEHAPIAPSEPIDWTAVVSADRDSR